MELIETYRKNKLRLGLYKDKTGHRIRLTAINGKILMVSESYSSKQAAKDTIKEIIKNDL
jgi:uncharacterized protein YegP (UPF0339 family)